MRREYERIVNRFYETGIIPVIQLNQVEKARQLGDALLRGGITVAEVTFRAEGAAQVIDAMRSKCENLSVGAGTVLSVAQAEQAMAAGAHFIVSPGFNPAVVEYCIEKEIPVFPGCITPTEIERAMGYGLTVLKFFPAEMYGGVAAINALSGPYGQIKLIPTGGVTPDNLESYLLNKAVVACGGSFMVQTDVLEQNRWEEVSRRCTQAVAIVKKVRG